MKQVSVTPRPNWKELAKESGFDFYQTIYETDCWKESNYYQFTLEQVEVVEEATNTLHRTCLSLVQEIASSPALMLKMKIPEEFHAQISRICQESVPRHLYGRFDFAYDGVNPPKMLEYNADTPTALYESAVWQWLWLEDLKRNGTLTPETDQFNSIHDKLCARWDKVCGKGDTIHFTCMGEFEEDRGTIRYLQDTASQAGFATKFVNIEDIGVSTYDNYPPHYDLKDQDNKSIKNLFKLYPWEWLISDDFGKLIPYTNMNWIEPIWKLILSNKAILPLLWERYPGHPNLLPAFFEGEGGLYDTFVRKPFFSREGSNITVVKDRVVQQTVPGVYGREGYIKQALATIPTFKVDDKTKHVIIGSWVIGNDAAGMIIRESDEMVTNNWSQLVPHVIVD